MGISYLEGKMNEVWLVERVLGMIDWEFGSRQGVIESYDEGVELLKQCFMKSNFVWYGLFV